jgi:hypothetical protein
MSGLDRLLLQFNERMAIFRAGKEKTKYNNGYKT